MYGLNSKCLIKCLNEKLIDFFIVLCCVDMLGRPNRQRLSKETMTSSTRQDRQTAHPVTKRGREHKSGGEGDVPDSGPYPKV